MNDKWAHDVKYGEEFVIPPVVQWLEGDGDGEQVLLWLESDEAGEYQQPDWLS